MEFDYDDSKCLEAKEILRRNKAVSDIWKERFAPQNKIGNCVGLYRKLKPNSTKDFFDKYIAYAKENQHMPIRDRGLTEDELLRTAERYKQLSEDSTMVRGDLSLYYYDMLCHIIYETYQGQHKEREFSDFLTSLGYECEPFDSSIDIRYGVDIKVTRNDGKVSAIQIKPISFFTSNRYDVQKDRIALCHKYEDTMNAFGIKTYYAIYNKDRDTGETKWLRNGNGFRFKINELFGYEKGDIDSTFSRKTLPNVFENLTY